MVRHRKKFAATFSSSSKPSTGVTKMKLFTEVSIHICLLPFYSFTTIHDFSHCFLSLVPPASCPCLSKALLVLSLQGQKIFNTKTIHVNMISPLLVIKDF